MLIYSFFSTIFFLLNSKTLNFLSLFSVRPTKLKLDTHMGKEMTYCLPQIQVTRIYLFLYFSSFSVSPIAKIRRLLQHTSDGYSQGYVSFAHSLLYLVIVLQTVLYAFFCFFFHSPALKKWGLYWICLVLLSSFCHSVIL